MLVYSLNLLITTTLNFLSRRYSKTTISPFLSTLAVLIISFIAGIRYGVGTDFFEYVKWFNVYSRRSINLFDRNFGFDIMIRIIQIFTDNPQWLFFISALVINHLVMIFIKRNTSLFDLGFYLFITLYLFYSSLNITRQWIAIAIFLYALNFAFEKKLLKFLFVMVIATSFHTSAILMLPLYFILQLEVNLKNMFVVFISTLIIGLNFESTLSYIAKMLPMLNVNNYIRFFNSIFATSGGGGWAYTFLLFSVFIFMIVSKKGYDEKIVNSDKHFLLMGVATFFSLFSPFSMIFLRVQLYLMPIVLVTLPNVVFIQNEKVKRIMYILVLVLTAIYMFRSLLINGGEPLPYRTFF